MGRGGLRVGPKRRPRGGWDDALLDGPAAPPDAGRVRLPCERCGADEKAPPGRCPAGPRGDAEDKIDGTADRRDGLAESPHLLPTVGRAADGPGRSGRPSRLNPEIHDAGVAIRCPGGSGTLRPSTSGPRATSRGAAPSRHAGRPHLRGSNDATLGGGRSDGRTECFHDAPSRRDGGSPSRGEGRSRRPARPHSRRPPPGAVPAHGRRGPEADDASGEASTRKASRNTPAPAIDGFPRRPSRERPHSIDGPSAPSRLQRSAADGPASPCNRRSGDPSSQSCASRKATPTAPEGGCRRLYRPSCAGAPPPGAFPTREHERGSWPPRRAVLRPGLKPRSWRFGPAASEDGSTPRRGPPPGPGSRLPGRGGGLFRRP